MTQQKLYKSTIAGIIIILLGAASGLKAQTNASFVSAYGYDSCIQLKNGQVEVVLEPNAGGRVIRYALNGVNVLYEDSLQNGWMSTAAMPRSKGHLAGGRFDIGPSRTKQNTDLFFFGKWKAIITGKLSARLTSQTDPVNGVYLVRDFTLDERSTKLTCRQTIVNSGNQPFLAAFWARTFATGNGICIMLVPEKSRFPNKYIMFMNRDTINMLPVDSNIYREDDYLIIKGPPLKPKLEMDVALAGWIAYAETNNLLFVKKFSVFIDKPYGDVTAANASIWYNGIKMTEIEPIGPLESILPGKSVSYAEEWFIKIYRFPENRIINPKLVESLISPLE